MNNSRTAGDNRLKHPLGRNPAKMVATLHKAYDQIKPSLGDFNAQRFIARFLDATEFTKVDRAFRLIPFAGCVSRDFGWKAASSIYADILEHDSDPGGQNGTLIVWINEGLSYLATDSDSEVQSVLSDIESIFEKSMELLPDYGNMISWYGQFCYDQLFRRFGDNEHLYKAQHLLDTGLECQLENDEFENAAVTYLYLGHVHYSLGHRREAFECYSHVDVDQLDDIGFASKCEDSEHDHSEDDLENQSVKLFQERFATLSKEFE